MIQKMWRVDHRIVRERGRQVIQKMWRVEQEHDVIRISYSARVRHHQVAPNFEVRDIVREETGESTSGEPSHGQGWLSKPGARLSKACGNRGGNSS